MPTRVIAQGGLGNQLFQLAYALKDTSDDRLVIDLTLVSGQEHVDASGGFSHRRFACSELVKHLGGRTTRVSFAPQYLYRKAVNGLSRRGPVVRGPGVDLVVGACIADFTPSPADVGLARAVAEVYDLPAHRLDRTALHVRLGDYRNLTHIYGAPSPTYYRAALRAALPHGGAVCVFSDEPAAAVSALRETIGRPYIFEAANSLVWPGLDHDEPWRDLLRMMACERIISANSTYSWWAAYLSRQIYGDGMAVAPRRMAPTGLPHPPGSLGLDWGDTP